MGWEEGPALTSLRPRPMSPAGRLAVPWFPCSQLRCPAYSQVFEPGQAWLSVVCRARDAVVPVVLLAAFWRGARVLAPLFSTHLSSLSHPGHSMQSLPCLELFSVGLLVPATAEKTRIPRVACAPIHGFDAVQA
jgi:hypothetical protein